MPNKDAYIARMKIQLDELNAGLDKLEGRIHVAEVKIMTTYESEMSALRLQLQKAHLRLDEVRTSGENTWGNLKTEMEKARDALVYAFHDFQSRI